MKRYTYIIMVDGKELGWSKSYKFFGDYFAGISTLDQVERLLNYHYAHFGKWMENFEIVRHTYDIVDTKVFKIGDFDTKYIKETRIKKMIK